MSSYTPPPPPPLGPTPGNWQQTNQAEHPDGTTILVLGILSIVVCGLLGPFAWNMGNKTLREIDANPSVVYRNRGNVAAGRICGMIATILIIVGVAFFALIVLFASAGA
jgi:phosphotransferase system  glucose/maltose/N-acetylglucosamine-specific IIC component